MIDGGNVLVTGAGGFLGGWLCSDLIGRGVHVVGLDKVLPDNSMATALRDKMDFVIADIEGYANMLDVLQKHDIRFVYHLAAQALVQVAAKEPMATFKSNIEGTWNILEAVRVLQQKNDAIKGIIVASSDKAYGPQSELPYFEDAPMEGIFPYDVSKSCADLIARSYFHSYKLPVCITRCGNLYGGGDFAFSRIVPGTIKSVLDNQAPIIRSDGTPVRDYVYVKDASEAVIELSQKMIREKSIHGEAFNISNETPISVLDLVNKILRAMNRTDLAPIVEGHAPLEIQAQYLSAKKMHEKIGWKAKFDLDRGLLETVDWYRKTLSHSAATKTTAAS